METNKKILGKINTQRCSVTLSTLSCILLELEMFPVGIRDLALSLISFSFDPINELYLYWASWYNIVGLKQSRNNDILMRIFCLNALHVQWTVDWWKPPIAKAIKAIYIHGV
jgi:hypothetical protein